RNRVLAVRRRAPLSLSLGRGAVERRCAGRNVRPGWKHGGTGGRSRGIPFPGLLGNPAFHRDPGGGAGIRVEKGGLRMALGSSDGPRALVPGASGPGSNLTVKPASAVDVPENTILT